MYINLKKRLSVVTAAFLLAACVSGNGAPFVRAEDAQSLREQIEKYNLQQKQCQDIINSTQNQKDSVNKAKDALDESVGITKQQISLLNQEISEFDNEIKAKSDEIAATQRQTDADYELFKQRICALYKMGSVCTLDIFLSSQNIIDFLSHEETVRAISRHDNELIDRLKKDEDTLKSEQAALQAARADRVSSRGTLAAKKIMLDTQEKQKNDLMNNLQKKIDDNQAMADEAKQKALHADAELNAQAEREATLAREKHEAELRNKALQESAKKDTSPSVKAPANSSSSSKPQSQSQQPQSQGKGDNKKSSDDGDGFGTPLYVVKFAEGFEGVPYVFGAADPDEGFDCSGLVQYVYANAAGIALPHSALEQSRMGKSVSKNNLQPGDLVFFDTEGNGVSHVGIYAGDDLFVEANSGYSTGHEVIETNLFSSSYWGKRFVCARRIL